MSLTNEEKLERLEAKEKAQRIYNSRRNKMLSMMKEFAIDKGFDIKEVMSKLEEEETEVVEEEVVEDEE